jgi:hypothetical protein
VTEQQKAHTFSKPSKTPVKHENYEQPNKTLVKQNLKFG